MGTSGTGKPPRLQGEPDTVRHLLKLHQAARFRKLQNLEHELGLIRWLLTLVAAVVQLLRVVYRTPLRCALTVEAGETPIPVSEPERDDARFFARRWQSSACILLELDGDGPRLTETVGLASQHWQPRRRNLRHGSERNCGWVKRKQFLLFQLHE